MIASLPKGAVILPGLDQDMPEDAWALLGPTHPQFGLKQLLLRLGVARDDVRRGVVDSERHFLIPLQKRSLIGWFLIY